MATHVYPGPAQYWSRYCNIVWPYGHTIPHQACTGTRVHNIYIAMGPEFRGMFPTDTLWRNYKTFCNCSNDKTMKRRTTSHKV